MPNLNWTKNLVWRVLIRVVPASAIVLVAILSFFALLAERQISKQGQERLQHQAEELAAAIATVVDFLKQSTESIAHNDLIVNGLVDTIGRSDYLPLFFRSLRLPGAAAPTITLTDYRGRPVVSNQSSTRTFGDSAWFGSVMEGKTDIALNSKGLRLGVPVLVSGIPEGAVVVDYATSQLEAVFELIGLDSYLADSQSALVLLDHGSVIFSSKPSMIPMGPGEPRLGEGLIFTEKRVPGFQNLSVITVKDKALFGQPAEQLLQYFMWAIVLSLAALVGGIAIAARMVSAPLAAFIDQIREIRSRKDLSHKLETTGPTEVRELAISFNHMSEELTQSTVSRRFMENILDSMTEGVFVLSPSGAIQRVNDAGAKLLGAEPQSLIGQSLGQFLPDTADSATKPFGVPVPASNQEYVLSRSGGTLAVLYSAAQLRDETGEAVGAVCVLQDITELKKSQAVAIRAQEENRLVLETTLDAFITADQEGRIRQWNRQAEQMFGWSREEAERKTLTETIIPPRFRKKHIEGIKRFLQTGEGPVINQRIEISAVNRDGREFPVELTIMPLETEEGYFFSAFVRDISERIQAQDDLKSYSKTLEQKNRDLRDFAHVVSHDLQEPLRKITTFGERLSKRFGAGLGPEGLDHLTRMLSAGQRMQLLVTDLLKYARATIKPDSFAQVDLTSVAHDVVTDLEALIYQTGGRVEVGTLPKIEANPTQMRQLIQNLIANALKFHRQGVPPVVSVYSSNGSEDSGSGGDEEGPYAKFTVEDNGVGFNEQYAEQIFGIFQRLEGRASSYEGSGVGLAICKKISQQHGGDITARSQPGSGSAFTVRLPLKQNGNKNRFESSTNKGEDGQ